jgi:hypothetical protein
MEHKTAERTMAVEKYLLDEFTPEERDDFEEHFFSCDECAREIKLGAAFMAHAKESLKPAEVTAPVVVPLKKPKRHWFSWLSPAFAVPAMALMLGVLAFQNLIQLPLMHQELVAMDAPSVLPSADLKSGISRGDESVVLAKAGEFFQLTIDIPDTSRSAHTAELYDASGRKLWALPISADAPKDGLALKMPRNLPAGNYSLVVYAADNSASSGAAHYAFVLHRN